MVGKSTRTLEGNKIWERARECWKITIEPRDEAQRNRRLRRSVQCWREQGEVRDASGANGNPATAKRSEA